MATGKHVGATLKRVLVRMATLATLVLLGFYVLFYFAQTGMVFHGERQLRQDPGAFGWDFEDVLLPVRGDTTHGWFVPLENARGLIFFCHGNDGNVSTRLGTIRHFRSLGFSTLIYDYGGFGRSTGRPSEKRVHADTWAMWNHLVETRGLRAGPPGGSCSRRVGKHLHVHG